MDSRLATAFAKRLDGLIDRLEEAWGIIANANEWNVEEAAPMTTSVSYRNHSWLDAAKRFRGKYHSILANGPDG